MDFENMDEELTTQEFGDIQKPKIGDSRVRQLIGEKRIDPRPRKKGKILLISKHARILPPGQTSKE